MKITKKYLQKLIKEELEVMLQEMMPGQDLAYVPPSEEEEKVPQEVLDALQPRPGTQQLQSDQEFFRKATTRREMEAYEQLCAGGHQFFCKKYREAMAKGEGGSAPAPPMRSGFEDIEFE